MKVYSCVTGFVLISLFSFAQGGDRNSSPFTVDQGVIHCEKGIPESPRWFADSRMAFCFDEQGIAQVDYYNPGRGQNLPTVFLRQLWDGFRYYLEKDGKTYKPEYRESSLWPFGIESHWDFEGAIISERVMAVDESIIIQLIMPDTLPAGLRLKLQFFESSALSRGSRDDLRFSGGGQTRKWMPWQFSDASNSLSGGFISQSAARANEKDSGPQETHCVIGADFLLEHQVTAINARHTLKSALLESGKTYSFCISFGPSKAGATQKNQLLLKSLARKIQAQFDRYRKTAANSPVLQSPYTELNNFISLAPLYHESLKITDYPGAIRAKTSNYWVWGWDGMTSSYATAYWGDVEHIRNMLQFYEATADSKKGIAHAFEYDMEPGSISALPAQGMYVSLLQLYYENTGDLQGLKDHYSFAKTIFNRIDSSEVAGTGFCEGSSLFPDFPSEMGETGHDISCFNNSIFYCAARSMESLAATVGDFSEEKSALQIIRRFERNFIPHFFNTQKQFVVSSIDSKTLQQRDSYNTSAIRWENNYCADLTDRIAPASLKFFKENAVTPMGLRDIPLWNKSYDQDANQLHCWWPVTGEYFMRLSNAFDQKPLIDQWIKWVSYWTSHLTCPEGISYYIETDEPEFDRWTSQKGTWQGYSIRGWYQAALHGVVGVGTDAGGLTFYPYSGEEMTLTGLNFRGKKFDISIRGSGPFIESIEIGGLSIRGSNKLPEDLYENKNRIPVTVHRVAVNPFPVSILTGTGLALRDYRYEEGKIKATLIGSGLCRLKLRAGGMPRVKLAGKRIPVRYDPDLQLAVVELNLLPDHPERIEIN